MSVWSWIWPLAGPTPTSDDLNSEMFDRSDYPYTETFVREALQNTLDARVDEQKPVIIRFAFHDGKAGPRAKFLSQAMDYRQQAKKNVPADWHAGHIKWLTVEDSNTTGLLGELDDRKGDFWNYWLNFNRSNKSAAGRGGRGIGRVTFLIASKINTVIGHTKRHTDKTTAACGMCVLAADDFGDGFKTSHSYLASGVQDSVFTLHNSSEFHAGLSAAFLTRNYADPNSPPGLSLVIPYPHDGLDGDGILASAVDHFAPAILNGSLIVEVDVDCLDKASISDVAPCVAARVKTDSIREGTDRYLTLLKLGLAGPTSTLKLSSAKEKLEDHRDTDVAKALRADLASGSAVVFELAFPMRHNGKAHPATVTVVAKETPHGKTPIDRLYREGMSLPNVKTRSPGDLDLILLIDRMPLAQYLNLCEGKAHLDLLSSMEVKEKLSKAGFEDGIAVQKLIRSLPDQLRNILSEQSDEPDPSVWDSYFSVPDPTGQKEKAPKEKGEPVDPPTPPPEPPEPNIVPVVVHALADGFRLTPRTDYGEFPVNVEVTLAYADGTGRPSWSPYDFTPSDIDVAPENCSTELQDNCLRIFEWSADSSVDVSGFDARRELDTRIKVISDAS